MFIRVKDKVNVSKEQAWDVVSDIENASKVFKDIKSIEIMDKPQAGLIGLKWKEVREFMGKEAAETMWITDAEVNKFYMAEAKNSGCLYHSGIHLQECEGGVMVSKSFKSTPQTIFAKLMLPVMYLMKGALKKCISKDLNDLKYYLEEKSLES